MVSDSLENAELREKTELELKKTKYSGTKKSDKRENSIKTSPVLPDYGYDEDDSSKVLNDEKSGMCFVFKNRVDRSFKNRYIIMSTEEKKIIQ